MLVTGWKKEIFRPQGHPDQETVDCFAHLDENIAEALPYLNAGMDADVYISDPPCITLKRDARKIAIHADKIALEDLADEDEAERFLKEIQKEVNDIWERRDEITPLYQTKARPHVIEILKRLPKTNCGQCGQPSCMVFATLARKGTMTPEDCPPLDENGKHALKEYLSQFSLSSSVVV